ncbi:hypothetical protein TcasGA2_TC013588 [Tribolium castaneum]|uniref:Uncharacterized protein n=1 Tax=Tribolium castaneum TaxID=7070 RepID=D6W742_TRICA|nr:PREDICTED: uncharacterized protein LOC103313040 [Tribolium castaneum]EFA11412.1 hypothetical protein TcasGA2_TC013588 [Tribolium castaneum]|eukprot:XP_008193453.1 PREDICTED: uncharacterized protein LOC103313040 [Tribolium castaneum]
MYPKCDNYKILLLAEEERIEWYKDLSAKNIELHKKIIEQEELITILKKKLLEKRTSYVSEYITNLVDQSSRFLEHDNFQNCKLLHQNLKEKLLEVNEFLETFNAERELFQQEIEENERHFTEHVSYLNGQVDYFRESLFHELEKSNRIKHYFFKKLSGVASASYSVVLETLKEESEKLNTELKSRYRQTIQKSKDEIERQSLLVSKLRKHNRQLYSIIQKSKFENETKISKLEKTVKDLKQAMSKLKEKNEYLHTQIKLEVEGCQNDIFDARRKIRTLVK